MNLTMDAKPDDDAATDEPSATDTPTDAETAGDDAESEDFAHLDSLSDGAGCAEVWEHLSETRDDD